MGKTITDAKEAAAALKKSVERARSVVFFGGAGVSTASGIPDFRSPNGLYSRKFDYPPETMLSHTFYQTHTKEFFDFYRACMISVDAKPCQAHKKLAELERQGRVLVIRPEIMPVKSTTIKTPELLRSYDLGYGQALRDWPRVEEYLFG